MIFSTDVCPLCNSNLELKILQDALGKIAFRYFCKVKELTRNNANTQAEPRNHYENRVFQDQSCAVMLFPEFKLTHYSDTPSITRVATNSISEPNKLIFDIALLDLDWSQPHAVCARLKLLVTFS